MTSSWRQFTPNLRFFSILSYFCAEGQHSQKLMIKNTWSIRQAINLDFSPFKSYECLVLQWNILEKCELANEKWGRWHLLSVNCSQLCVYFLNYFSWIGSKIYQINKKSEQKKLWKSKINYYDVIPRFYNLHLNLYSVIGDVTDRSKKSEITF